MIKVIILDCGPSLEEVSREFGQSPDWIISALEGQDCEFDWIKAYAGQTMENSSGDAWIITGSPRSVYDEEDTIWVGTAGGIKKGIIRQL